MHDRGIIYVASQRLTFVCEAILSARSVVSKWPDIPLTLFTDIPPLFGRAIEPFHDVVAVELSLRETDFSGPGKACEGEIDREV